MAGIGRLFAADTLGGGCCDGSIIFVSVLPDFDQLWDYDHPADTEQKFRAVLEAARASANAVYYGELLTQIARAQGLQRKFDEAHRILDEVEMTLTGDPKRSRLRIRYLLERGRVLNSSRHPDRARPLFWQAWKLARTAGEDFYAVDAAHMLGIVGSPEVGLDWNEKALALAEQSADPKTRKWLGSLYNNMGWTHHDAGRYAEALELFEKALKFRQAQGMEQPIRIAKWCVARCLRSLGRVNEALVKQRALEAEGEGDYVFEEIGECLLSLGLESEAQPYFAKAYSTLSKDPWLAESEPARLERLKQLGKAL